MAGSKEKCMCFLGLIVCCFVCIVCFIQFFTMKTVPLNKVALKQSSISRAITEEEIYFEGRYLIGFLNSFITYSTLWHAINFQEGSYDLPISSKTSDPSNILVSVNVMYKIKPEFIYNLYFDYPTQNHHSDMVLTVNVFVQDLVSKVVNEYTSDDFFKKREEITYTMAKRVSDKFRDKFYSELMFFQLNSVSLDTAFEESLIEQQVNKRQSITAEYQQEIEVINGAISVIESQADIDVETIIQEGNVEAKTIRSELEAQGEALILQAYSEGYSQYMDTSGLNFTDTELIKYIFYEEMRNMDGGVIVTGFDIDNSIFTT